MTINSRRKIFSLLRGPFSQTGIVEFIRELVAQKGLTIPFRKDTLPTIQTVEPWDGKDGEVQMYCIILCIIIKVCTGPKTQ